MIITGTQQDIFNALWDFLTAILPTTVLVILGQDNRVAPPKNSDYVVMTYMGQTRLSTDHTNYNDPLVTISQPLEARVQLDVHGPSAADNVVIITTLFRSAYACDSFKSSSNLTMQPLYTSEPNQLAFINDSLQFEDRWSVDAVMQFTQTVNVPVVDKFADTVKINLDSVK